ncbi:MAG: FtsX-like permease family protein [Demequinaceae bacterium]|nr:FtsX-like permease family protein [Demequinaceae bacterium]
MLRLAWKTIRHNPKRLILTTIAVVLATSFVSGTFVLTNAIQNSFNTMSAEIYGETDIQVLPAKDDENSFMSMNIPTFDETWVGKVAAVDGVDRAAPVVSGMATLMGSDGKPNMMGGMTIVIGWNGSPDLDNVVLVDGHAPLTDSEIVLDSASAENEGYEIGDRIELQRLMEAETFEYTLVGLVEFGQSNSMNGMMLAYLSYDEAQVLVRQEGEVTNISIVVEDGYDPVAVRDSIREILPPDIRAELAIDVIKEMNEEVASFINVINIFVLVFAFIAVIVGALLITNTFQTLVTQRTRELGLLRAIAGTPRQIRTMILLEAIIIGLIGSVIGLTLGYGMASVIKFLLASFAGVGANLGALTVPIPALIWGFATGIGTTTVAAMLPAIRASRISPMEAMREEATQKRRGLTTRTIVGSGFFAAALVTTLCAFSPPMWPKASWVGITAGLALIGTILLIADLIGPLATWIRPAFAKVFGINGTLAMNNSKREPRRMANTAGALVFSVMLLAMMTTVTSSIKSVINEMMVGTSSATFIVSGDMMTDTFAPISDPELASIGEIDGVTDVHFYGMDSAEVDGKWVDIVPIDAKTADAAYEYNVEPSFSTLDPGEIFVSEAVLDEGYRMGDTITLTGVDGELDLVIVGTYLQEGDPSYWVSWSDGRILHEGIAPIWAWITIEDGADAEAIRVDIEAVLEDNPRLDVGTVDEYSQAMNSMLDGILASLMALLGMALVIGIFGVANTLFLSVAERTREIGLLRAVGLSRKSVRRIITLESVFMSLLGAFFGFLLGVTTGAALVLSFDMFEDAGVTIPWVSLAIYTAIAVVAGILAAIVPARRAANLDILKAITTE